MERMRAQREWMKSVFGTLSPGASDQSQGKSEPPIEKACPPNAELVALPPPDTSVLTQPELRACIASRRSRRHWSHVFMSKEELSFLLWATQGVQEVVGEGRATMRTVPSGGARHAFETYLIVNRVDGLLPAVYRYRPVQHELLFLFGADTLLERLNAAVFGQRFVSDASVVFIWTCVPYRGEEPISKGEGQYKTTIGFLDLVAQVAVKKNPKEPQYGVWILRYADSNETRDAQETTKKWWSDLCQASDSKLRDSPRVALSVESLGKYCHTNHHHLAAIPTSASLADCAGRACALPPGPMPQNFITEMGAMLVRDARIASVEDDPWAFNGLLIIEVKIKEISMGDAIRQLKFYREYLGSVNKGYEPSPRTILLATRWQPSKGDIEALLNEKIHHVTLGDGFTEWMTKNKNARPDDGTSIVV